MLPSPEPEKSAQYERGDTVSAREVDTGAALFAKLGADPNAPIDEEEALRIRRKVDRHVLPMMMILYFVQFMDKTTLSYAAILGITKSAHLSTSQYNWLGTIFYLAYLAFEYPQNLALQRFPVGKWMSLNIFVWSIALMSHAACTSFGGLMAVRFVLGMCEGSITAGFLIVSTMFYTRKEQTYRIGWWFLMNGTAQIVSGFLGFGVLHIHTQRFEPWQWLMIITGMVTLLVAVMYWLFFPDSPTNAWFLTPAERLVAITRLRVNQTGVENKQFKPAQMVEALMDPKTWLFALFALLANIPNSLTNQRQLIVASFGFGQLQVTLLGCVDGFMEIVSIAIGVWLAARRPNMRAWVAVSFFTANILGAILVSVLPWHDKIGLLFSIWVTDFGAASFVLALAWVGVVTAGHTKRVTTNAIMLSAYCIGNAVGPFMWQAKYKPRNRVPWTVIGICGVICPLLLLAIRALLARENRCRDAEHVAGKDDGYGNVRTLVDDGKGGHIECQIDRAFLDLTDRQNRDFRYVL